MRIGIDYRILGVGRELMHRGIGRYTQQQLRAVLQLDPANEYVLMCNSGHDQALIDPAIIGAPNVSIVTYGAERAGVPAVSDTPTMLRQAERYFDWVSNQDLDVFHATAPFHYDRPVLTDFDVCPLVTSFYDLIPLIYPTQYLSGWWEEQYLRTLSFLSRSTRMIAISESARIDATRYLGFPPGRIDVAWPIADECFRILDPAEMVASLTLLRRRVPVPDRYVLTVSHLHHTKNLTTLLRAYALLPQPVRSELPLVVCCHLDTHSLNYLRERANRLGVGDDLVLTDLVSDEELTALYNGATAVVHPSRYEGFGLPVVEAMKCGAPVVTTTASSLPEAAGDAASLVDPDDAYGFALAIQELYEDPSKRETMRERGLAHSSRFTARLLAERTLESYRVAGSPDGPSPHLPRLAVFIPVPVPAEAPVFSDHDVGLLDRLREHYDIEVFLDDGCMPPASLLGQFRVKHSTGLDRRHAAAPFDAFLYQVGRHPSTASMRDAIRTHPGVVALDHRPGGLPLYDDILAPSLAQIVYGADADRELRHRHDGARVSIIPVGVIDPARGHRLGRSRTVRSRWGALRTTFVVGVFGTIEPPPRLGECIKALAHLSKSHPDALLVIVGPAPDDRALAGLIGLAEALNVMHQVRFVRSASGGDVDGCLLACDVVINLESRTTVAQAVVLMKGMAAGRPLIASHLPWWPEMPTDVVLGVDVDADCSAAVGTQLVRLVSDHDLRVQISARSRCFYEDHGTADAMAGRYVDVLERHGASTRDNVDHLARPVVNPSGDDAPSLKPFRFNKVCEVEDFSRPELLEIIRDVCAYKLPKLPVGFPVGSEHRKDWEVAMAVRTLRHFGALHRDATILGVAAGAEDTSFFLTREAKQVFATDRYLASGDWEPTAPLSMLIQPQDVAPYPFDADRLVVQHMDGRSLRYPDDTFDGIYSSGSIEHFGDLADVACAAYEMGRVLKPGGVLTLSTEIRLGGPPGGIGWPGLTLLFSEENLQRFIIDASGLEPVDELDAEVSDATLAVRRDLTQSILQHLAATEEGGERQEHQAWEFPHIILLHEGYVFTSVHLALRKPSDYPRVPNTWARPSDATVATIVEHNRDLIDKTVAIERVTSPPPAARPPAAPGPVSDHDRLAAMSKHVSRIRDDCAEIDQRMADLDRLLVEVDRHVATMAAHPAGAREGRDIAASNDAGLTEWAASLGDRPNYSATDEALHWRSSRVSIPGGVEFDVVVDPRVGDQVTFALSVGLSLDQLLVKLMTDIIRPGDRILDIGAHVGTFSLAAAALGAQSLAIEASPENAALLRASAARNGFRNVTVVEAVASAASGQAQFRADGPWGQVSLDDDRRPEMAMAVTAPALSVADLLAVLSWSPVAFVKMDVEGWELQVLKGMGGLLDGPGAPPILYECNGHTLWPYQAEPEDLIRAVAAFGYTSYMVDDDRLVEVDADAFQPQTLVDYLAVKRMPALPDWPVHPPLDLEERVARIVADGTHANHNHRIYIGRTLERAEPEVLRHPSIQALLEALRHDHVEDVCRAANAWTGEILASSDGGTGRA